eukprot:UN02794
MNRSNSMSNFNNNNHLKVRKEGLLEKVDEEEVIDKRKLSINNLPELPDDSDLELNLDADDLCWLCDVCNKPNVMSTLICQSCGTEHTDEPDGLELLHLQPTRPSDEHEASMDFDLTFKYLYSSSTRIESIYADAKNSRKSPVP